MSSSRAGARKGEQRPRVRVFTGDAAYSDGPDADALAADLGVRLFPWESSVLSDWCSRDEQGRPAVVTAGLSVPRQNGKNLVIEVFEVFCLAVLGWHVIHTAHRVKTAKKSFNRLVKYFTDRRHPELSGLVENIRYTNGEEAIYLKSGACIEFSARSRANTRGFDDIQLVVFDEAQDLTDDQLNAIMYTLAASASGDRMMLYTGTPPDPSSPGTVFGRVRAAALADPAPRTSWNEWSVEKPPPAGSTFADVLDLVYATNPSMGHILDEEFTATEFANASIDGFARERLGWWSESAGATKAMDPKAWDECRTSDPPSDGLLCCGVKFAPDGSRATLAVCLRELGDGPRRRPHVEVVRTSGMGSGTRWIADWLDGRRDRVASVAIDGTVGVTPLVNKLEELRFPKAAVKADGLRMLCPSVSAFADAVNERAVTHFGQPALDAAAKLCNRRKAGADGIGFEDSEDGQGDATMLEACALAYQQAMTTKRRPGRKQRVG